MTLTLDMPPLANFVGLLHWTYLTPVASADATIKIWRMDATEQAIE
jgi:hypothetical protein